MDKIVEYLKNLFTSKDQSVVGIDIGSSSIKVVQLKKKGGKAVLETYGEIALGPYGGFDIGQATNLPPEKIAQALIDVMKEANVTTLNAGVAIPIKSSLITVMELPDVGDHQLANIIPIEARKYIPVPISEVKLDWTVIPNDSVEQSDLPEDVKKASQDTADANANQAGKLDKPRAKVHALVVAIHNDTLTQFTTTLGTAGIATSFFEIEIFGAVRSTLDQDTRPVMVVDMGAASTKLYIIERGVVRNSHIINRGSQDITMGMSRSLGLRVDAAEKMKRNLGNNGADMDGKIQEIVNLVMDSIFAEANSVLLTYQRRYNKNVAKIILTGGGATLKGVAEKAFSYFQIETKYGTPFDKVQAPAFLEEVLRLTGREFAVAVGVALRKLQELE